MRLQVSVQRNALPPVRIVHNTSTRTANNVRASTIAELLDSISTLVPLESSDGSWGLEDYVVEVRATSDQDFAYECLHYQLIEDVLQEDDEVIIRALRTEELRERRVGGRDQISGDGRHLLDGVSWGRRVPLGANGISRPQVDIPPRKRRRIEVEVDAEDEGEELLQLTYPDEEDEYDEDEDSDQDGEDEDSESSSEDEAEENAQDQPLQIKASAEFDNLDSDDSSGEETADEQLQDELQALVEDTSQPTSQSSSRAKRKRLASSTSSSSAEPAFNGFSSPATPNRLKRTVRGSSKHASSDPSQPGDSSSKATDDIPSPEQDMLDAASESDSDSSEGESAEDSSEDEMSGVESSSASTDSSDDTSDNDSDEQVSSSATSVAPAAEKQPPASDQTDNSKPTKPVPVPPGHGMSKTKRNNARKRRHKMLTNLQEAGVLDSNADFATLRAYLNAGTTNNETSDGFQIQAPDLHASQVPVLDSGSNIGAEPSEDAAQELAAKKSELLRRLNSQEPAEEASPQVPDQTMAKAASPMRGLERVSTPQAANDSSPQRAKLDLASSRRMLFNSLGVRTPKTPEEEQALREKLSKPARSAQTRSARDVADEIFVAAEKPQQKEHWSEKLVISAVECYYIGRKIDVPSFPFKHPWQIRKERLSQGLVRADQEQPITTFDETVRNNDSQGYEVQDMTIDADVDSSALGPHIGLEPQPSTSSAYVAGEMGAGGSSEEESFERLPDLKWAHLAETAIIAFKELELGPTIEPVESGYKKAKICSLNENGTFTVEMLTIQQSRPMQTDEITGERIFSKLEMPVSDDRDDDEDRFRDLDFFDLRQPKLVKAAHVQTQAPIEVQGTESQPTNGEIENNEESAIIPESIPVAAHDMADVASIAVSTQTRNDINGLIHDAGFESGVDEQLLQPLRRDLSSARASPSSVRSRRSQHSDGGVRLRGGINTIPEDARVYGEHGWNSSQPHSSSALLDIDINIASSDPSESMVESVRYPHLSQLELDTSDIHTQAKSSSFQDAQIVPPGLTVEDTTGFGSLNQEESSEKPLQGESTSLNLEYLGSEVGPSQEIHVKSSPPPEQQKSSAPVTRSQLVDAPAETGSPPGPRHEPDSDVESLDSFGLPSLRALTSSQRNGTQSRRSSARVSQRSPSFNPHSKDETNGISYATSSQPHFDDDVKLSHSQAVRLSQIPEDNLVVDLTQTSSPEKGDSRTAQGESPRTRASKRKAGSIGEAASTRSFSRALNGLGMKKTRLKSSQV